MSDPLDALLRQSASTSTSRARLRRHAASFFQANRYLVPDLVAAVHRAVSGDRDTRGARDGDGDGDGLIIDLYAGVGLFALTLAAFLPPTRQAQVIPA